MSSLRRNRRGRRRGARSAAPASPPDVAAESQQAIDARRLLEALQLGDRVTLNSLATELDGAGRYDHAIAHLLQSLWSALGACLFGNETAAADLVHHWIGTLDQVGAAHDAFAELDRLRQQQAQP